MKLHDIINSNDIDYCGKLIYRSEWNKYHPHKAIKLHLTSAELVYVPDDSNKKPEVFDDNYKFSMYEIMVNDWEYYEYYE